MGLILNTVVGAGKAAARYGGDGGKATGNVEIINMGKLGILCDMILLWGEHVLIPKEF